MQPSPETEALLGGFSESDLDGQTAAELASSTNSQALQAESRRPVQLHNTSVRDVDLINFTEPISPHDRPIGSTAVAAPYAWGPPEGWVTSSPVHAEPSQHTGEWFVIDDDGRAGLGAFASRFIPAGNLRNVDDAHRNFNSKIVQSTYHLQSPTNNAVSPT